MLHNFQGRIQRLQQKIQESDLDGYLVCNPTDLFYLTGLRFSLGTMVVTADASHLIVDGRYAEAAQSAPVDRVILAEKNNLPPEAIPAGSTRMGFNQEYVTVGKLKQLEKSVPHVTWEPQGDLLLEMRSVKEPSELIFLRKAADLNCRGYDFVVEQLHEDITEKELARKLEIFWLEQGGEGISFEPIVAFGAHSSMPPYRPGDARLKRGMTVLIDIGVQYHSYQSDMTRTLFFGKPDPKLLEIYLIVQEAQQRASDACRASVTTDALDKMARDWIDGKGYGSFFSHSLGHGVGLDIHELPILSAKTSTVLQEGMVITVEPGIYLPGLGGVRIEDTLVVTKEGAENLIKRSKELIIL